MERAPRLESAYARIGDIPVLAREESRNEFGDLLYSRDFRYVPSTLLVGRPRGGDYALPTPRVTRITDSAGGVTRFTYSGPADGRRWQHASTTIDDGKRTIYRFDADGAPVATETAKGTVEGVWDRSDLLLTSVVAEDGTRSEYQYDRYGNVIRATEGEEVTPYRYWPPDRFELPYIKDRVSEVEDRSGRRYYCYDRHGRQAGCPNAQKSASIKSGNDCTPRSGLTLRHPRGSLPHHPGPARLPGDERRRPARLQLQGVGERHQRADITVS